MNAAAVQALAVGMAPQLLRILRREDPEQLANAAAEALRQLLEDPTDRQRVAQVLALISAQISPVHLVR